MSEKIKFTITDSRRRTRVILQPNAPAKKRITEGLRDIRKGRVVGPFKSMSAMVKSLAKRAKKTKS